MLRRLNMGDIHARRAAKYPGRAPLVFMGLKVTFEELNRNCCLMAHVFQKL
ncbi:MAG: hypothetical protein HPY75_13330 [Actinobacteria bacterium]|nr:hypothetical protein [Actinomycetota bacterium]